MTIAVTACCQVKSITKRLKFMSPNLRKRILHRIVYNRLYNIVALHDELQQKGGKSRPVRRCTSPQNSTDYLMSCHLSKYIHCEQRIPWVGKHLNETWSTKISLKVCTNESNWNRKERDRFRCHFSYLLSCDRDAYIES